MANALNNNQLQLYCGLLDSQGNIQTEVLSLDLTGNTPPLRTSLTPTVPVFNPPTNNSCWRLFYFIPELVFGLFVLGEAGFELGDHGGKAGRVDVKIGVGLGSGGLEGRLHV